jgi:pimeloyl-ACP methyl ester carboxylesterase
MRRSTVLFLIFGLIVTTAQVDALDRIIFRDGHTLTGAMFREQEKIVDGENGVNISVPKAKGFDVIDNGLRYVIFSKHAKQAAAVQQNIKPPDEVKEYMREVNLKFAAGIPPFGKFEAEDYDKNWKRMIKVTRPNGQFQEIHQTIKVIGPQRVVIPSTTHRWYPYFATTEYDFRTLRKLLTTHPDLDEKGVPNVKIRLALATFFFQADLLDVAKLEIENAKKDVPVRDWTKEQVEQLDKLTSQLAKAEAKLVVELLDLSTSSGQYDRSRDLLARFDAKSASAELVNRFTTLKAQVEILEPQFEKAKRLLRQTLDELRGPRDARLATIGGVGTLVGQVPLPPELQPLCDAGEQVLAELHPDTITRIETFVTIAGQSDNARKHGNAANVKKPEELLALAVSGWLMGKNGTDNTLAGATRLWKWRELLVAYLNEDQLNRRRLILNDLQKLGLPATTDIVAQLIQYLPPIQAEDLSTHAMATAVAASDRIVSGVYRRTTGPIPETAAGQEYYYRVPSEYHHGRSYPLLVALAHPTIAPDQFISMLAPYADRHGYIIVAPTWGNNFSEPYNWKGDHHYRVTSTIHSICRHFHVNNNRVALFGFGEGANFAMDVAASHPDLFCGALVMGPNPKWIGFMMHYWRNLQKLPMYCSIGTMAGGTSENIRAMFEPMMMKGYPALCSIYRGRAMEWLAGDLPDMFDWLSRKKRVTGTQTLRLNQFAVEPWQILRAADNRFYWVSTDAVRERHLMAGRETAQLIPATIKADIHQGNHIILTTLGVNRVNVLLDREMIDWAKPVKVTLNSAAPSGYKPKVIEPDLGFMLENYREHYDRSLLFLAKLELNIVPQ